MKQSLSELPFQEQAVLWGHAYEILVKRGVIACLIERKILLPSHSQLSPWKGFRLLDIHKRLSQQLGLLDDNAIDVLDAAIEHLALTAFGVGYTAMREYLKPLSQQLELGRLKLRALWCPLTLPGDETGTSELRSNTWKAFHEQFQLNGLLDPALTNKGMPANADFILWLSGEHKEDYLLVQEYSYDMPPGSLDFREQSAHLDELMRHRRLVDSRGVFSRVAAEVDGESFSLSEDIRNHLGALTSENKPFYKLCQGAAYAESTVTWLQRDGSMVKDCSARALAITPNGLESLAANFTLNGKKEPRRILMEQMGAAYRSVTKIADGDGVAMAAQVEAVFNSVLNKLPKPLKDGMKALRSMPAPGEDYCFEFEETLPKFANPMQGFAVDAALALVDDSAHINNFFGESPKDAIGRVMNELVRPDGTVTLRDMHAAAIVAGMQKAVPATLNVIALEGNPGIGKTTAVRRHLEKKTEGYLFLYVSPRVIINRDVTESLARKNGKPSGILTVTTNAQLIASAERWHLEEVKAGRDTRRHIDGAVIADGVLNLVKPIGSILVIDPEQEQEIERVHTGSRMAKVALSENEDMVQERSVVGVLSGMAKTTQELLALNPEVNRVVLTAALQGFREKGNGKTTMDALSTLFRNKASVLAGVRERLDFSKRMPNIVVMVDELAGDGAGAPFVHGVARWLHNEFIGCFDDAGQTSPFTVTLVISDASLGNEIVLERYLNAGDRTPDKVLVSRSAGIQPFRIAVTSVRVGGRPSNTLHVMTNSFPASELKIRYQVNLTSVKPEINDKGDQETPRQAVRRASGESLLASAEAEILNALTKGGVQVIYFAQDKGFLSDLEKTLASRSDVGLNQDNVQILDSSVPGWRRKKLIEPETRDQVRVFLMTSSGARGVSFPKTNWIIAAVPRFSIEAALMEIAQLIYRGRGQYKNDAGEPVSGDYVPRQLVMLVDDFVINSEEEQDKRQWLRQSLDLMTLLVMLRATIHTRITGDAALRQPLALVPVGRVGLEELVSLMSENVTKFVSEAEIFCRRASDRTLIGVVKNAQSNVMELFSRTKLQGDAHKGKDGRTMVKYDDLRAVSNLASTLMASLLVFSHEGTSLADHIYFAGPCVLENWEAFAKQEAFTFEGHQTQIARLSKELLNQLYAIEKNDTISSSLRVPASNLYRLLQREAQAAANEFTTFKTLKSPNTWVSVPAGYLQFVHNEDARQGQPFQLHEQDIWCGALARSLMATGAVMPPIPKYESFPWAASVGQANPLRLDLVFDDRYFMASNELNLLNTLLLS